MGLTSVARVTMPFTHTRWPMLSAFTSRMARCFWLLGALKYTSLQTQHWLQRERGKKKAWSKLQTLVYDILPSTTAVFSYVTGSWKLSANEQFFVGVQTVVSLLQTTQIKQGVSFIAANKVYTSTNKTTIVWIEMEISFFPWGGWGDADLNSTWPVARWEVFNQEHQGRTIAAQSNLWWNACLITDHPGKLNHRPDGTTLMKDHPLETTSFFKPFISYFHVNELLTKPIFR